jgi:DNA-binding Lrp family transcriptional regulator
MDDTDKAIINTLQNGFPVCASPYQQVAEKLGITEAVLIERLEKLLKNGTLSRFGPMYHAEVMGGALTLAAVKAPEKEFSEVSDIINSFPEVAHNYARSHAFNMWFIIATETPERIREVIQSIEQKTGLSVYNMPKLNEYFVQLKLEA